eukprot:6212259-Pleurochrysis_carterae.AAC.1
MQNIADICQRNWRCKAVPTCTTAPERTSRAMQHVGGLHLLLSGGYLCLSTPFSAAARMQAWHGTMRPSEAPRRAIPVI